MSDTEPSPDGTPIPLKQDPEALVLRGRPRPVIRFRKGLIIGLTGVLTAGIIALAWASLEPPTFRLIADPGSGKPTGASAVDAIAGAPATYGDVPKLGPPLPGDLGRPILEQQLKLGGNKAETPARDPEAERLAAEQQRLANEEQAAHTSSVLVQLLKSAPGAAVPAAPSPVTNAIAPGTVPNQSSAQQRKLDFARSGEGDTNHNERVDQVSPWTLSAGTVVPASLITGLNSDLPGMAVAQVTQNVRDSALGQTILIPQGARLIGSYDSAVAFGQQRALLVWERIVFPDGSSVRLDKVPATDVSGYAGLEDKVDFHEWRLLKGIVLSSLLGVGSELSFGGNERDLVRALRESAQANGARAGEQIVSRNLDVQPTLTVRPGWPVRAILHRDLILKPWAG